MDNVLAERLEEREIRGYLEGKRLRTSPEALKNMISRDEEKPKQASGYQIERE